MLLQSRDDLIELLPALPDAWQDGRVTGLRARGGYELDIEWKSGKLIAATLKSKLNGNCTIRYGSKSIQLKTKAAKSYSLERLSGN
jgi:alpha-L-fucosidase 2